MPSVWQMLAWFAQAPWYAGGLLAAGLTGAYVLLMMIYRWGWMRTPESEHSDLHPATHPPSYPAAHPPSYPPAHSSKIPSTFPATHSTSHQNKPQPTHPAAQPAIPATHQNHHPSTPITVIVPARNEAGRIGHCVQALCSQDYPAELYEILVIDDFSRDGTAQEALKAGGSQVRVIALAEWLEKEPGVRAFKKKAIEIAVAQAKGQLILTTDADARPGQSWLSRMAAAYERKGWKMIAGPVSYYPAPSMLGKFQELDFLSLVGIAAASIRLGFYNLCNGANLAYEKAAFEAVGGFEGIDQQPSGDDMMLMHKIGRKFPGQIGFLKDKKAIVRTFPEPDLAGFWQQRLRWASKSTHYEDRRITLILVGVWLFNLFIPLFMLLGVLDAAWFRIGVMMLFFKIVADTLFQVPVLRFFNRSHLLWNFLPMQLSHIVYVVFMGPWSTFAPYRWKGRRVDPQVLERAKRRAARR